MTSLNNLLKDSGVVTMADATETLLEKFGLNWTVSKQPLSLPNGKQSGFFGITRDDTGTVFTTAREGYEVYQNSELLELVNRSAGEIGLSLDRGGIFKGGGLVYLQLASSQAKGIGSNNDSIDSRATATNAHDGSLGLRWGVSTVTISCANTFVRAVSQLVNNIRHTASMRDRVATMVKQIQAVQTEQKSLYEKFFAMANVPATRQDIIAVTKAVLGVNLDAKGDDVSTRTQNNVKRLSSAILSEMAQKGDTRWGLFSGVTYYTTHDSGTNDVARFQSKNIGANYATDNKVFAMLSVK